MALIGLLRRAHLMLILSGRREVREAGGAAGLKDKRTAVVLCLWLHNKAGVLGPHAILLTHVFTVTQTGSGFLPELTSQTTSSNSICLQTMFEVSPEAHSQASAVLLD